MHSLCRFYSCMVFLVQYWLQSKASSCGPVPIILRGYLSDDSPDWPVGTILTIHCFGRYVVSGPAFIVCQHNTGWTEPGECVQDTQRCPRLQNGAIENSLVVNSDFDDRTGALWATFICLPSYQLIGPGLALCELDPSDNDWRWNVEGYCRFYGRTQMPTTRTQPVFDYYTAMPKRSRKPIILYFVDDDSSDGSLVIQPYNWLPPLEPGTTTKATITTRKIVNMLSTKMTSLKKVSPTSARTTTPLSLLSTASQSRTVYYPWGQGSTSNAANTAPSSQSQTNMTKASTTKKSIGGSFTTTALDILVQSTTATATMTTLAKLAKTAVTAVQRTTKTATVPPLALNATTSGNNNEVTTTAWPRTIVQTTQSTLLVSSTMGYSAQITKVTSNKNNGTQITTVNVATTPPALNVTKKNDEYYDDYEGNATTMISRILPSSSAKSVDTTMTTTTKLNIVTSVPAKPTVAALGQNATKAASTWQQNGDAERKPNGTTNEWKPRTTAVNHVILNFAAMAKPSGVEAAKTPPSSSKVIIVSSTPPAMKHQAKRNTATIIVLFAITAIIILNSQY